MDSNTSSDRDQVVPEATTTQVVPSLLSNTDEQMENGGRFVRRLTEKELRDIIILNNIEVHEDTQPLQPTAGCELSETSMDLTPYAGN